MDANSNQLSAAVCRNGQADVGQIVESFYERVYAFLRRLAGNDADAEDLTQRAFIRVAQALPSFAGRSTINTWIHSIAYRIYLDWRRANHRTESRSDEWWAARASRNLPPDRMVEQADLAGCVFASVEKLDPEIRAAVHLHYYQGLSLQETAEAMDIAPGTVKYRLRQAVGELQRELAENPGGTMRIPGAKHT